MLISLLVPAPFDLVSGGYGYDRRIVAELRAAGHEVDVIELTGTFPFPGERERESACRAFASLPPRSKPVIDGLALPAIQDAPDTIAARGSVGLIHHPLSMETGLDEAQSSALAVVEHRLFPRLTRIIVTSATTAETLTARFHISQDRIRIVVPGTDAAPRCQGRNGPVAEIVSIGTLIPRKGHDVLLRALATLPDLNWHLTIVGSPDRDPACARDLIALATELNIARHIRFAGEMVGEALEAIWRASDLFALTTHYEGYGMAIAEALKRGLPVVITAGGAAGDLIAPQSGMVCPVGDHQQVANALRELIAGRGYRCRVAEHAWRVGQALPSWRDQGALFAASLT
jgi:glycosyltransferase involved in cell wall biosynthesis